MLRNLLLFTSLCIAYHGLAQGQRLAQAEWFIGSDPGEGLGTAVQVADGAWDEALEEVMASLPSTPPGNVVLSVRMKGANGYWSSVYRTVVHTDAAVSTRDVHVQQGEFFFDGNPGEGNGTPLLAFDGDWNAALETGLASATAPAEGDHLLYVRLRAADGQWSNEYKTVLHVSPSITLRSIAVQAGEYYFDTDPGEGNATPLLALDGDFDGALEQALASASLNDQGSHVLGVRVRGADDGWSATFRSVVHVGPELIARDVRVQQGEFFFDSDPGEGNGTPLLAFDGNWSDAVETGTASEAAPAIGHHLLYVRMRGGDGTWSNEYKTVLHVSAAVSARPVTVVNGEYYWDTDPGEGNGSALNATDGGFDEALEEALSAAANNLSAGSHLLGVRLQGSDGGWSAAFRQVVHIAAPVAQNLPVAISAFLQGPMTSAAMMSDALRTAGLIPLTEPFTSLGFAHMGSGGETITPSVLAPSIVENVTDWIFVELRDATDPALVLQTRCGLITDHGRIVGTEGFSNIAFNKPPGNYHVSVKHRNHLGVMTQAPLALGASGAALDLRLISTPTHGTNSRATVFGRAALWSGDVNGNGEVKYTGIGNDRDPVLLTVGSTTPNNTINAVYSTRDVNMNGQVKYTGSDNDRDPILVNIGSTTPNNVRNAQLP